MVKQDSLGKGLVPGIDLTGEVTESQSPDFAVGDTVIIHRPSTGNWIHDMGMDLLTNPWTPGSKDINMDRTITRRPTYAAFMWRATTRLAPWRIA